MGNFVVGSSDVDAAEVGLIIVVTPALVCTVEGFTVLGCEVSILLVGTSYVDAFKVGLIVVVTSAFV